MEKQFQVGVIGCGGISRVHRKALSSLPNVKIAAVADIVPERAQEAAGECRARALTDWREMLKMEEIDAVHICTPHYLHPTMAVEALRAGKHVLTEKPMAISNEAAMEMIRAADEPNAPTLGVVFQNRYNPSVQMARTMLASGALGAFQGARASVCWHREGAYYTESGWRGKMATEGGGVLINQAIHTLDLMSYLVGPIEQVRGHVSTDVLDDINDVEDSAHAVVQYKNGCRGVLYATVNYVTDAPIELELACEKGALKLVGDKLWRIQGDEVRLLCDGQPPMEAEKAYWGASHQTLIADFYRALAEGRHFWLDGRQGFPAFNLVMSIFESSKSGKWVKLIDPSEI